MVGPWLDKAYTFRALKTFGPMWLRCDVCRRYARLHIGPGLRDVDYRTKTFSCSRCGADASVCVVEPIRETGMEDYRLEEVERPNTILPPLIVWPATGANRVSTIRAASCPAAR